ncbi:unnamed protein product, partial [Prorocentrum cordatum]
AGCNAHAGYHGADWQNMNLAEGCWHVGTALHELGHVLGLHHEHERFDRDEYVEAHLENVPANPAALSRASASAPCRGRVEGKRARARDKSLESVSERSLGALLERPRRPLRPGAAARRARCCFRFRGGGPRWARVVSARRPAAARARG